MRQGYRMLCDLEVPEQRDAFDACEYDSATLDRCLALLPAGGVALDIGANVGFYACAFGSRLRANGHVHAFEPVPTTAQRLEQNIALNALSADVSVVRCALGSADGTLTMHVVPDGSTANAVGDNMLSEADRQSVAAKGFRQATAPIRRLDDWSREARLDRCDLIKIDVEGAELLVFEGAQELLARHRPIILGEFNPYWMAQIGRDFGHVRAMFEPLGYRLFRDIDGTPIPVSEAPVAKPLEVPSYWLVPDEKLARFGVA